MQGTKHQSGLVESSKTVQKLGKTENQDQTSFLTVSILKTMLKPSLLNQEVGLILRVHSKINHKIGIFKKWIVELDGCMAYSLGINDVRD